MAENRELALVLKLVADQFQSELRKSGGAVGEFTSFVKDWRTQVVAGATALFALAKSTANYGDDLFKTSQKVGVQVEALAGLQYAATLADLSHEQLSKGLMFLSQNIVEAARGTGDGEALFRRMGIAAETASGQLRPTEEVLLDVADAFARSADDADKTALAVKLFSKAGMDLIPFLNQGKAGIKELMEEARRLGLVMSEESARASEKFNDDLTKIESAAKGVAVIIGTELVAAFQDLLTAMEGMSGSAAATNIAEWIRVVRFGFKDLVISSAELAAYLEVIGSNILDTFSEEGAAKLDSRIAKIHKMAEEMREQAAAGIAGVPPVVGATTAEERKAGPKGQSLGSTGSSKADLQAHAADLAAKDQAIKNGYELLKVGYAREKQLADAAHAQGKTSLVQSVEEQNRIKEKELAAHAATIQKQMVLREAEHEARRKLGFETKELEGKDAAEHTKAMADLQQQLKVLNQEYTNAQLQGQADVQAAQNETARQQLALLFAGANALAADREKRQAEVVALAQAWEDYDEQVGASDELRKQHMTETLVAQLAQQTDLTREEIAELLQAWVDHESEKAEMILARTSLTMEQKEAMELNALRRLDVVHEKTSNDVFGGWSAGMRKYVQDTKSGFGLGADMARRTAQLMESSFKTFFFDLMENRIKSFKDVLKSLGDFAKQIFSQVLAQLATAAVLSMITKGAPVPGAGGSGSSIIGALFGSGKKAAEGGTVLPVSRMVQHFATGGTVLGIGNRDTVPALLTPGEVVLSRRDVKDIKDSYRSASASMPGVQRIQVPETKVIVNNYGREEVRASSSTSETGEQMIYITVREAMRRGIANGDMDKALAGRFRLAPSGGA